MPPFNEDSRAKICKAADGCPSVRKSSGTAVAVNGAALAFSMELARTSELRLTGGIRTEVAQSTGERPLLIDFPAWLFAGSEIDPCEDTNSATREWFRAIALFHAGAARIATFPLSGG